MNDTSLGHTPNGNRWEFDDDVTRVFDDMLERSIPQYQTMRSTVASLVGRHATTGRRVVDVGCSRGAAIAALRKAHTATTAIGLEVSPPMVAAATERFADDPYVRIIERDLREKNSVAGLVDDYGQFDAVMSILTLQFVPIEYRLRIVGECYRSIRPGGAMVVVEKVLGATDDINEAMVDEYLRTKNLAGYSWDEIERKRASLEGVLVPVTARWNEDLLASAGFEQVDCFWRWMNFAGWIAVKTER